MRLKKTSLFAGLATLVCVTGAVNGSAPGFAAAPNAGASKAASCGLESSAHRSDKNEWLSCFNVSATLDRLPAVGETARLTVQVRSDIDVSNAKIAVELPANLAWVQAPAGMSKATVHSTRPETSGLLDSASSTRTLSRGGTQTFTAVVRATAAGDAQIRARVTAPVSGHVEAGSDDVFLTVGGHGQLSRLGAKKPAGGVNSTVRMPAGAHVASAPGAAFRSVTTRGLNKGLAAQAGAPCDTRVAGSWVYQDQSGVWRASRNTQVQVWDDDVFGDAHLATGITDNNGNYNICFDSQSEGFPDSGTADIYVKFISENSIWKVVRGGSPLTWQTGVTNDVPTGSTLNKGSLTTGDPALHRGLHAFDEANSAWLWIPKPHNLCFDQDDASCRQLKINWAPDSTDGTYYSLGANDVHLAADDPNAAMTVVHEIGHAIMDDVYNDAFPAAPNCNPHSIQGTSSAGCAWTEGWAEWFPATVFNDPFFRWPNGASLALETQGWGDGRANGDTSEGRIAGSLIDLTDATNEGPWDRVTEGPTPIWNVFMNNVSGTLGQFWAQRGASGGNVGSSALSTLFNNTVDYGFRDPLSNYVQLSRPTPVTPHNFGYNTTTNYWSVVAVRPNVGSNIDMQLYDDWGMGSFLKGSSAAGTTTDFIAVDSNRRPLGDYYPRTFGSGGYLVELAQGSNQLPVGTQTLPMGTTEVVAVRDVFLTAGVKNTFRVTPGNSTQNPALFLMSSNAADSSTWIKSRAQSTKAAFSNGAGQAEVITYTPTVSGWYGLVVINNAASGQYTLKRTVPAAAPLAVTPRK
jgi:hypothetical protein